MNGKLCWIAVAALAAMACGQKPGADTYSASADQAPAAQGPAYHPIATIPVGGEGGWDYLSEDTVTRRLYVSHATKVVVVDMERNAVVGEVDSLPGVHGFAVAHDLNRGFASDGRENKVAVVDLGTLQVVARVETGENPDGILYLPDRKEVWAFNGRGQSATVIDAGKNTVVATIPLSGKPEFAVYDPAAGRVYNNIEDKSEVAVIDVATHQVVASWPIAPGEEASGLAIDLAHHRLFAVCGNSLMVMLDSSTGAVVGSIPIGDGSDAARFDPATQLAFSSNGAGTVTVAHLDAPDRLTVVQTLETTLSARTMTLDPTTHRIYLSAADMEPPPAPTASLGRPARPRMVPGSFKVLVYGREG
ncbi:MAG: YncE family protein [Gemmatimonadetes bacterium]|nr:YncE family protein [Gemmatimonadota bacterium]